MKHGELFRKKAEKIRTAGATCAFCERPLPPKRKAYCSDYCRGADERLPALTDEQKRWLGQFNAE
ncbi:MAG: hypothetical protein AAF532_16415 [Planctomycetota bacterium]